MARPPRYFAPKATYHIILKGNNAQPIFHSDAERARLCLFIQEEVERFRHRVVAFCFMTNHIHLAIQVRHISVSRFVQHIAARYAQFFNKRHKRIGHLFQGRFRSVLVDSRGYLRTLIRYIHLNPVRAGMVEKPQDYRWSSHRAYLQTEKFTWLSCELGLGNFGQSDAHAVASFHKFVMAGLKLEPAIEFEAGTRAGILGDSEFIEEVTGGAHESADMSRTGLDLQTILATVTQYFHVDPETLSTPRRDPQTVHIRAVTALLARREGIPLHEIAARLARDPSVVSKAASKLEAQLRGPAYEARAEIEALSRALHRPGLQP